jgi:hypothetical protein
MLPNTLGNTVVANGLGNVIFFFFFLRFSLYIEKEMGYWVFATGALTILKKKILSPLTSPNNPF